mmetsp:Transcript_122033/g.390207  ORF Transcript_122033/g.390207 Transcript_122033/m.390207 type:complete len:297 (-) Transcript_122033:508-1398(-)
MSLVLGAQFPLEPGLVLAHEFPSLRPHHGPVARGQGSDICRLQADLAVAVVRGDLEDAADGHLRRGREEGAVEEVVPILRIVLPSGIRARLLQRDMCAKELPTEQHARALIEHAHGIRKPRVRRLHDVEVGAVGQRVLEGNGDVAVVRDLHKVDAGNDLLVIDDVLDDFLCGGRAIHFERGRTELGALLDERGDHGGVLHVHGSNDEALQPLDKGHKLLEEGLGEALFGDIHKEDTCTATLETIDGVEKDVRILCRATLQLVLLEVPWSILRLQDKGKLHDPLGGLFHPTLRELRT